MKNIIILVCKDEATGSSKETYKDPELDPTEKLIRRRLRGLGYSVVAAPSTYAIEDGQPTAELPAKDSKATKKAGDEDEVALVIISPLVDLETRATDWLKRLADLKTPLVVINGHGFEGIYPGFAAEKCEVKGHEAVHFLQYGVPVPDLKSGLELGLTPSRSSEDSGATHPPTPHGGRTVLDHSKGFIMAHGYKAGAVLGRRTAPERRVVIFLGEEAVGDLNRHGWRCVAGAISWALGAKELDEVLKVEWADITTRRTKWFKAGETGCKDGHPPKKLTGLALSGGGIRSATFSLGVLQGLNQLGLLGIFDYISTVSGGGFTGGWWSAWLSRDTTEVAKHDQPFPRPEMTEPRRLLGFPARSSKASVSECSLTFGDPIHHLRLFSNYLTPRKGAFSGDLWRAIAVLSRNLVLTWVVLIPILFSFVLAGQLYFVLQRHSIGEFFGSYYSTLKYNEEKLNKRQERLDKSRLDINVDTNDQVVGLGPAASDERDPHHKDLEGVLKSQTRQLAELDAKAEKAKLRKQQDDQKAADKQSSQLWSRIKLIAAVLIFPLGWLVVMTLAWMRSDVTKTPLLDWIAHTIGTVGVGILLYFFYRFYAAFGQGAVTADIPELLRGRWIELLFIIWAAVSLCMWVYIWPRRSGNTMEWRKELRRNKIEKVQAALLVGTVLAAFVLVFAGFGHDIAAYFWYSPASQNAISGYVAKAGGWGAIIVAIGGSIYTAVKTSPKSGAEQKEGASKFGGLILAITPPIVLIVLAVLLATFSHWILNGVTLALRPERALRVKDLQDFLTPVMSAAYAAVLLGLFFAIYEMRKWGEGSGLPGAKGRPSSGASRSRWRPFRLATQNQWVLAVVLFALGLVASTLLSFILLWLLARRFKVDLRYLLLIGSLLGTPIFYRLILLGGPDSGELSERATLWGRGSTFVLLLVSPCLLIFAFLPRIDPSISLRWVWSPLGGIFFCALISSAEILFGNKCNSRSAWLLGVAYAALLGLLTLSLFAILEDEVGHTIHTSATLAFIALGLLMGSLGWTVAFGWMADPNLLSLHRFYKNRLVRAYMGASNNDRTTQEITEVAENDDVFLGDLKNCKNGAPYPLINTTLNLVGGKDLGTAQRRSASFVMSPRYCGSSRTGYRYTRDYMSGRLSIGAAVAVSGAAVSPSMGARTMSTALSMLMTLLNVRLGFWAPTPNKASWQAPSARLWPFYTLFEFLSQTNDLSSYCCLTDGGHFDNTGLYSLVERGCRYILLVDNGADPKTSFQDLGDAIRRCRIDFSADIDLDITDLFRKQDKDNPEKLASAHFAVGDIRYCKEHLVTLGWPEDEARAHSGKIVVLKPSLAARTAEAHDKTPRPGSGDAADVRQYGLSNEDYPQQSTANQWFDEAQFESYRELGHISAKAAFTTKFFETRVEGVRPFDHGQSLDMEKIKALFEKR
jgi:hypothetical protein